jgi:hypothetical protein
METFRAHHADILDPAQEPRVLALLHEHGLVTFTGSPTVPRWSALPAV